MYIQPLDKPFPYVETWNQTCAISGLWFWLGVFNFAELQCGWTEVLWRLCRNRAGVSLMSYSCGVCSWQVFLRGGLRQLQLAAGLLQTEQPETWDSKMKTVFFTIVGLEVSFCCDHLLVRHTIFPLQGREWHRTANSRRWESLRTILESSCQLRTKIDLQMRCTWTNFCCLPRLITRKLNMKNSNLVLNQRSDMCCGHIPSGSLTCNTTMSNFDDLNTQST